MTLEEKMYAVVSPVVHQCFPVKGPFAIHAPVAIWERLGGTPIYFMDNTAADKSHAIVRVTFFETTAIKAAITMKEIEKAMVGTDVFLSSPRTEPVTIADENPDGFYILAQDFNVWFTIN